jgi:type II secretory pathway component HofQ
MAINIKKDDIKGFTNGVPSLSKRSVTTGVMVDSGDTVVIGGVYEFRTRDDVTKVPWLADLPISATCSRRRASRTAARNCWCSSPRAYCRSRSADRGQFHMSWTQGR